MTRERSTGELSEDIDEVKGDIKEVLRTLQSMEQRFAERFVPRDLYEAKHQNIEKDIATLKAEGVARDARISKAVYTAVTAIIAPVIISLIIFYLTKGVAT